ncbi:MAG: DUF3445 domain-containing protein [Rubrivivax sp.]|nr:DUF3445 domain-containing protein [Rubrivivax sp.]
MIAAAIPCPMAFDFDAAVGAPSRMQPGLRRVAAGCPQLTPLAPGSRHQREKLAVLSAFWTQALLAVPGFDATPALAALVRHAAIEHPDAWRWNGESAEARRLGTAVHGDGRIEQTARGRFGLGDEVARCLHGLPPAWRLPGLLSLAFAEDFVVVDRRDATVPWLAVALPSHWAPEQKVGHHFAEIHAPAADSEPLRGAGDSLMQRISGSERWERFAWNVTDQPRLHAHPARVDARRWQHTAVADAWWRTERQTFIPVPGLTQAVVTIHVEVQRLAEAIETPERAAALHAAVASMSDAVLACRGLSTVREPLLDWLAARR